MMNDKLKYQKEKRERLYSEALSLFKNGFSSRKIGKLLGRSHTWAWRAVDIALKDREKYDIY